ncbi:MAG: PDZ domain-containing protein, partial [Blastocatellia bacterium]|nr:PDZ domain-containing protein [Blastocatellia bacterium]
MEILDFINITLRENYYDPNYHGIDLDAHFKSFREKLKQSKSDQESMVILAASLLEFNDSHTVFLPPAFEEKMDPGWTMMMIGETCVINKVDPQSDAEKKGLKAGDIVLSVDGAKPLRKDLWKIDYLFRRLNPLKIRQLVVQSPGENPHVVTAAVHTEKYRLRTEAEVQQEHKQARQRYLEMVYRISDDVGLWKIPEVEDYDDKGIDQILDKIKGYKKLVLDLRGNPGGQASIASLILGCLFNRNVEAAEMKYRKKSVTFMVKPHKKGAFEGELVALVDSKSASAAEMLARVIQLEKRGKVMGDLTAGKVIGSNIFTTHYALDPNSVVKAIAVYGVQLSVVDLIMSDGKSLEGIGVQPDELL